MCQEGEVVTEIFSSSFLSIIGGEQVLGEVSLFTQQKPLMAAEVKQAQYAQNELMEHLR